MPTVDGDGLLGLEVPRPRAGEEPMPVFRAAHLLLYLNVLRDLGAPWVGELRRAKLPTMLIERPDAYLPLMRGLEFLAACEHYVDDLALRGARQLCIRQLSPFVGAALNSAPTLYAAFRSLHKVVGVEATRIVWWLDCGPAVRLCSRATVARETRGRHFVEWHQNHALVRLVRTYAGPEWCPHEMAFESNVVVTRLAHEQFPDTRFLVNRGSCWIAVPPALLSLPAWNRRDIADRSAAAVGPAAPARDFVDSLRVLLKTYLAEGAPTIRLAADIAGTSVRTLQRRLARVGLSYSDLLDEIRLEAAAHLLTDSANDVIDIAYELGYGEPSSFSRAFRRLAGLSPRQFRRARSWVVQAPNESSAA